MALSDFLGNTSEIRIIDFLAENPDMEYNMTELGEYIGISRVTLYEKLPELIHNKLVTISKKRGRMKYFKLAENKITEYLIKAVFAHSFMMAKEEREEEEVLRDIRIQIRDEIDEIGEWYISSPDIISNRGKSTFTVNFPIEEQEKRGRSIKIPV
ncbi:ArsR/SmtB family transcription factor [Candidatus Pyrohabitans sp.]